jgi:hypothetical protein
MFAFHAELVGSVTAHAERMHDGCSCATVTVEDERGGKVSFNRESRAALLAIGLAMVSAAESLPDDPGQDHPAPGPGREVGIGG